MAQHSPDSETRLEVRPKVLESISVLYRDGKRVISCFCGNEILRSIVPHLKKDHSQLWDKWVRHFVSLRSAGSPPKRIMRLYRAGNGPLLFSWTVIERAVRDAVESGAATFTPAPSELVKRWEPEDFQPSVGTIWDFPKRGNWAVHSGDYRGNWPPQLVRNLILKYTEPDDLIVDAFVGGGTTLIEAWLCGRRSLGLDISRLALQTTRAKLDGMEKLAIKDCRMRLSKELRPVVIDGDALVLGELIQSHGFGANAAKLLCAHPPYLDSLKYTGKDPRDLSAISDPEVFYETVGYFAQQAFRTLEDGGVCALLIGDVRKGGRYVPLGFNTAMRFELNGFDLESVIIKTQNHDRSSEFYRSLEGNAYLLEHEYLFILRKPVPYI